MNILISMLKNILVRLFSAAFLEWMLFWVAGMIVESTKTTKDDEFLKKIKEIMDEDE